MMQYPTLTNTRIRTARDALHVFHGVARHVLPIITRRLDADERREIKSGNIYVWEERGTNSDTAGLSMERWTDGLAWGPSRVREEFLYYTQRDCDQDSDSSLGPISRRREHTPSTPSSSTSRHSPVPYSRRPRRTERLIKQTYSVHVSLPQDRDRGITRKWHLTAYFSQETVDSLNAIASIQGLGDIGVPDGWFRSARAGKVRRGGDNLVASSHATNGSPGHSNGEPSGSTFDFNGPAQRSGPSSLPSYAPYPMYSYAPGAGGFVPPPPQTRPPSHSDGTYPVNDNNSPWSCSVPSKQPQYSSPIPSNSGHPSAASSHHHHSPRPTLRYVSYRQQSDIEYSPP
ncbi:hypothetical protein JAAARDRAFT_32550, partial [Jaapia argillacea MUCL 33604]